jgi:hypothetical protein
MVPPAGICPLLPLLCNIRLLRRPHMILMPITFLLPMHGLLNLRRQCRKDIAVQEYRPLRDLHFTMAQALYPGINDLGKRGINDAGRPRQNRRCQPESTGISVRNPRSTGTPVTRFTPANITLFAGGPDDCQSRSRQRSAVCGNTNFHPCWSIMGPPIIRCATTSEITHWRHQSMSSDMADCDSPLMSTSCRLPLHLLSRR